MTDTDRYARNVSMLMEVYGPMRKQVASVLVNLERAGYKPRIQCAWRHKDAQLKAFKSGHSKAKWGLHCATSYSGKMEALAVDILDDAAPLNPGSEYKTLLRCAANAAGLRAPFDWDPCHVEAKQNYTLARLGHRH